MELRGRGGAAPSTMSSHAGSVRPGAGLPVARPSQPTCRPGNSHGLRWTRRPGRHLAAGAPQPQRPRRLASLVGSRLRSGTGLPLDCGCVLHRVELSQTAGEGAGDGVQLAPSASAADIAADQRWISTQVRLWLDEEWTPLPEHERLGDRAAEVSRILAVKSILPRMPSWM